MAIVCESCGTQVQPSAEVETPGVCPACGRPLHAQAGAQSDAVPCPAPPAARLHQPLPPPRLEWLIAVMMAVGIALAGAGVVAFVEATRFGPTPPASAGTHEWGTQRIRPPAPADSASGSASASAGASGVAPFDDPDEPVLDVDVHGSSSAPHHDDEAPSSD